MKKPPISPEFDKFTAALRDILRVTPADLQTRTAAKKQSGKRLSKGASLDLAASSAVRSATSKP